MVQILNKARDNRDCRNAQTAYTITDYSADNSLSSTEAGAANVAAVLATVINDLIEQGILSGTVDT